METRPVGWRETVERHRVALAIGLVVGLALVVVGLRHDTPTLPVYVTVTSVGAAATLIAARRGLSRTAVAGLVLFGLGNLAGGLVPVGDGVLYGWWLLEPVARFDNLQHAIGFGAVGRTGWELLRPRLGAAAHDRFLTTVLVIAIGTAAGAANEVVEWVMTLTIPGVDIGGYDNTARDLGANLVGSGGWAVVTVRWR